MKYNKWKDAKRMESIITSLYKNGNPNNTNN